MLINKLNFRTLLLLCGLLMGYASYSYSALITVELEDFDGPHIFGVVDTTLDNFTINSWTENLGGVAYYTPASLPMVWIAQNAAGVPYDVPDSWDGTIDNTWGFRTPALISWNEGPVPPLALVGWGIGNFPVNSTSDHTILDSLPVSGGNRGQAHLDVVKINGVFIVGGTIDEPPLWSLILVSSLVIAVIRRGHSGNAVKNCLPNFAS